ASVAYSAPVSWERFPDQAASRQTLENAFEKDFQTLSGQNIRCKPLKMRYWPSRSKKIPARNPTAGTRFPALPWAPGARPESNDSCKRAAQESPVSVSSGLEPRRFRTPLRKLAGYHPALRT